MLKSFAQLPEKAPRKGRCNTTALRAGKGMEGELGKAGRKALALPRYWRFPAPAHSQSQEPSANSGTSRKPSLSPTGTSPGTSTVSAPRAQKDCEAAVLPPRTPPRRVGTTPEQQGATDSVIGEAGDVGSHPPGGGGSAAGGEGEREGNGRSRTRESPHSSSSG